MSQRDFKTRDKETFRHETPRDVYAETSCEY